jgi:hypothetical protein
MSKFINGEQLNKSNINKSPSKQMYSFSRDERFRKINIDK